jgi:glycosyltransferase involved in cell wall biosynthesis
MIEYIYALFIQPNNPVLTAYRLSVIMPAYNEEATIYNALQAVSRVALPAEGRMEIIVINDCSTDRTELEIKRFQQDHLAADIQYVAHPVNQGKGAALHSGIGKASGDYIIVQDADLEYDPNEFTWLLAPILSGRADVVYGSRFMGDRPHRVLFFLHTIGNKFLTFLSNLFTNINLTDMETCYKLFRADMLKSIQLKEKRFGFEPEVTAKISKIKGIRIYEVGISYYGRTYAEGKKINWKDGFRAIWCIMKYNWFK